MATLKYAVGIDVSKSTNKACFVELNDSLEVKVKSSGTFSNNLKGFQSLLEWSNKHRKQDVKIIFVLEATGIYYEQLAWFLYSKQASISVILPNKAKRYLQSLGLRSKNDKIDAQGLSFMAAQQALPLWKPLTESFYTLRSLTRHQENLQKTRTALRNQLHAMEFSMYGLSDLKKSLKKTIGQIEKEIEAINRKVEKIVITDPVLKVKYEHISKVKGIGIMTFAVVASETNGFELFENQRQLISYAGYDVVENQSGLRSGKTRISKKGNTHIRRAMHMPALITVKNNEVVYKNLFERVYQRSKVKMKGYVAIQKKLLCLMYTLWKNDTAFDPAYYSKNTSGNQEPKDLFPVDSERILKKSSTSNGATQDKLPCNQSPEVLFPVIQNY